MSEIKVNSIKGVGASAAAITVNNSDGTATANLTNRQNRNVIINGDFQISQRATSITSANAYLCDRWQFQTGGLDENCTQEQVDVASGTSPYGLGFRKALKITNGNQTSGAGAADYMELYQYIEGHNMATCGWDYKNPNSKMTLSFWIKSSVAQKFAGFLYTTNTNGTSVHYMYDYSIDNGGSNLTADTWTKITHTFPGNSSLNITNGPNYGLGFGIYPFQGTNTTTSRSPSNAWQSWTTSNKVPDMASTWYTTNDATLEITGVQLEVGSVATDFEHRSFAQELQLCKRYYEVLVNGNGLNWGGVAVMHTSDSPNHVCNWVEKRATPSLEFVEGSGYYRYYSNDTYLSANKPSSLAYATKISGIISTASSLTSGSLVAGGAAWSYTVNANAYIAVSAEL